MLARLAEKRPSGKTPMDGNAGGDGGLQPPGGGHMHSASQFARKSAGEPPDCQIAKDQMATGE